MKPAAERGSCSLTLLRWWDAEWRISTVVKISTALYNFVTKDNFSFRGRLFPPNSHMIIMEIRKLSWTLSLRKRIMLCIGKTQICWSYFFFFCSFMPGSLFKCSKLGLEGCIFLLELFHLSCMVTLTRTAFPPSRTAPGCWVEVVRVLQSLCLQFKSTPGSMVFAITKTRFRHEKVQ